MDDRLRILDTDIVSLWQRHPEQIEDSLMAFPEKQRAVTIITVEEQFRGHLAMVRRARDSTTVVRAYTSLYRTFLFFTKIHVLPFDDAVATKFAALQTAKIRIGTQDLRIAAIVLSCGGVLVTRNTSDFSRIPELAIEDWTRK